MAEDVLLLSFGRPENRIRLSSIEVNNMRWAAKDESRGYELPDLIGLRDHEFVIKLNEDGIACLYRRERMENGPGFSA